MNHDFFMHRCLEFAEQGRGKVGINPMVGAVLVRDGKVIVEAFHSGFGKTHAERDLLENFEQEIRSDDILYVNLEPCCHSDKKTPPCSDILLERGVKRVIFGMLDPNPQVNGKGIDCLRSHGVECIGPVLVADCMRLNRGFTALMNHQRPWITMKSAQASDGSFSCQDGSPKKITSETQDAWSHSSLRARHDALLVGVETIIRDDPELTVRHGGATYDPYRIILDPHTRMPPNAKILQPPFAERTIVVVAEEIDPRDVPYRVVAVPAVAPTPSPSPETGEGRRGGGMTAVFDWKKLWTKLTTPDGDFHGITSILLEGGVATWKIFQEASMVDEEVILVGD